MVRTTYREPHVELRNKYPHNPHPRQKKNCPPLMDSTVAFTTTVASEDSKIAATTIVTPNFKRGKQKKDSFLIRNSRMFPKVRTIIN